MRVTIASAFRDAQHNISAYLSRVVRLRELLGPKVELRVIAGEGDSVDHTRRYLECQTRAQGIPLLFADCAHGGPRYGSTEQPERLKALSFVLNQILDAHARGDHASGDAFIYVEQDLQWEPQTLVSLLACVKGDLGADVFAPLVMAGSCFYDTWGFRLSSREDRFGPYFPYSHGLRHGPGEVTKVYSVGSCLAMSAQLAAGVRVENDYALVGWCERARELGATIGVCANLTVRQA